MFAIPRPFVFLAIGAIAGSLVIGANPADARNFNLATQNAQVSKRIKAARPKPMRSSIVRTVSTRLSCEGEGNGWSCPGIAQPGTEASLTYSVTLKK